MCGRGYSALERPFLSPVMAAAWIIEKAAVFADPLGSSGELLVAPEICNKVKMSRELHVSGRAPKCTFSLRITTLS
jgi:hypothetical protein